MWRDAILSLETANCRSKETGNIRDGIQPDLTGGVSTDADTNSSAKIENTKINIRKGNINQQ